MDINDLISQKRAMLVMALNKVQELERQISALEGAATADDLDLLLASKVQAPLVNAHAHVPAPAPIENTMNVVVPMATVTMSVEPTLKGRNPKGATRKLLLDLLADGQTRDLDFLEQQINARLPNSLNRATLRTALMNMRQDNEIVSPKAGHFCLAAKGESPAVTGLSGATESDSSKLI